MKISLQKTEETEKEAQTFGRCRGLILRSQLTLILKLKVIKPFEQIILIYWLIDWWGLGHINPCGSSYAEYIYMININIISMLQSIKGNWIKIQLNMKISKAAFKF